MEVRDFSTSEAIHVGWEKTKAHLPLLLGIYLTGALIQYGPRVALGLYPQDDQPIPSWILVPLSIIFYIFTLIKDLGFIQISLNFVQGVNVKFSQLFSRYDRILNYFIALILNSIIVLLGLVALIVPGVILMYRLQFYRYYILDKKMGPIDSLKASWRITQGNVLNLIVLSIILGCINLLGLLALGIGLCVTIPLTDIANAHVFKKLDGSPVSS